MSLNPPPSMAAVSQGVTFVCSWGGGRDLSAYTVTLLIGPGYPNEGAPSIETAPLSQSGDNRFAYYKNSGTEALASGGRWLLRMKLYKPASGPNPDEIFVSAPVEVYVYPPIAMQNVVGIGFIAQGAQELDAAGTVT